MGIIAASGDVLANFDLENVLFLSIDFENARGLKRDGDKVEDDKEEHAVASLSSRTRKLTNIFILALWRIRVSREIFTFIFSFQFRTLGDSVELSEGIMGGESRKDGAGMLNS